MVPGSDSSRQIARSRANDVVTEPKKCSGRPQLWVPSDDVTSKITPTRAFRHRQKISKYIALYYIPT